MIASYFCTTEWHLARAMDNRITFAALLYPFALQISFKSGVFWCSGPKIAKHFRLSKADTVYDAIELLEKIGFFVYINTLPGGSKRYKVLTHREWARNHTGECPAKVSGAQVATHSDVVSTPLGWGGGTHSDGEGVPTRMGTSINRVLNKKEEREKEKPKPPTLSDKASGQVVILIRKAGGTLFRKDLEEIKTQIRDNSDWTESEIDKATKNLLASYDEFELKHAGNLVATSLAAEITRIRLAAAEKARIEELSIELDAKARAEAIKHMADLEEPEEGL